MNFLHTRASGLALLALSLSACLPSGAQSQRPSAGPTEQDLAAAYHTEYRPAGGSRTECVGRLAFEVPKAPEFEWGLPKRYRTNEAFLGFSRILRGGQDMIHMSNVSVLVVATASLNTISEMQRLTGVRKSIAMQDFDEKIATKKLVAKDLAEQIETPELKADLERIAEYRAATSRSIEQAQDYERRKQDLDKDWHPTDWGIPESTGYIAGPTLYAFILRGGFAFQFMATGGQGEAPFDQRLADFKDLLSRFEYRPLYQVPTKPGLCIPHGFINDSGQGHFSAEVSFRYADAPGVIYTLGTAVEGERNFNANPPTMDAAARSTVAGLMGNAQGRKLTALGPKSINIGARAGVMSGIATATGTPGYSIFAGTSGWDHSSVLPYISLNMRSFDKETAPDEIKVNPPPLATSLQRFEMTLGSLRTRKAQ